MEHVQDPDAMSTEGELSLAATMAVWLALFTVAVAWLLYRSVVPSAAPPHRAP